MLIAFQVYIMERKKGFPTFATLVLVVGVLWLLSELQILTVTIPWFPVIMIIVAIGWIVDHYSKTA